MKNNTIDSKNAGLRNENLILRILRQNGELSQSNICKLTGLGSSTVSYITGRLREKNLILGRVGHSNQRGAKPVILNINPEGKHIISISINPSHVAVGLFDFTCKMKEKVDVALDGNNAVENVCSIAEITVHGLLGKYKVDEKDLLGIGVVLSGTIGPDGVVKLSSPLGWKDVELKKILAEKFQCDTYIYSTRVRFLAEIRVDPELASKSALYLNVADGVGGTLFADGRIIDGATGRFAELGHIVVDPDGPLCGCGHKGCLEAFISGPAIAKKITKDIESGTKTILSGEIIHEDMAEDIVNKWGQAINRGDNYAISLREKVAEHLSKITAVAIDCFDPQVVVLAGYVLNQSIDYFVKAIESRLGSDVYDNHSRKIEIKQAKVGKDVLINAVATAILQDAFTVTP
jgi:predicted NBD/HSP70 family sugar kinase